jgi:hypothetical protein
METPFLRESGGHTTPLNQIEGILVGAGELIQEGVSDFSPKPGWEEDAELVYHSTNGTNARGKLIGRIERSKELLRGEDVKDEYEG